MGKKTSEVWGNSGETGTWTENCRGSLKKEVMEGRNGERRGEGKRGNVRRGKERSKRKVIKDVSVCPNV